MKGLLAAGSFLTRIPVGRGAATPAHLSGAVVWFPVVGGVLGLGLAGVYAGSLMLVPRLVAAAVAIGAGLVLTGAFHEDALADTADALAGRTREQALRILRDPAHGTYGVSAIVPFYPEDSSAPQYAGGPLTTITLQ